MAPRIASALRLATDPLASVARLVRRLGAPGAGGDRAVADVVRTVTGAPPGRHGGWTCPAGPDAGREQLVAVAAELIARGVPVDVEPDRIRLLEPLQRSLWCAPSGSGQRACLPADEVHRLGWDAHYARLVPTRAASGFARTVLADGSLPRPVLDLGCGAGADTAALAAGRPVVGVDRSSYAVELARSAIRGLPADQRPDLQTADVTDARELADLVTAARGPGAGTLLVYVRGLFDTLDADGQAAVLDTLAAQGLRGDALAIETGGGAVPPALAAPGAAPGAVPGAVAGEWSRRLDDLGWTVRPDSDETAGAARIDVSTRVIARRRA